MKKLTVIAALAAFALPQSAQAADKYEIDGAHAAAVFSVNHLGTSTTWGRFNDVSGSYMVDAKAPHKSNINVTIKTASVDTANKKRDEHLRGPDFFNAKQFPTLTFKSTKVSAGKGGALNVTGDLSLHGVTKTVTVPVKKVGEGKDPWGGYRTGYDATFTIDRNDYGMSYMKGGIGDTVTIHLALEGVKK